MKVNQKTKLIIILAFVTGILFGLKLLISQQQTPKIIETTPKNNQEDVPLNQTLKLTFNRSIKVSDWQIFLFPTIEFSLKAEKDVLEIIPKKELTDNTQYKIEVKNNQDPSFFYSFSFKTIPVYLKPEKGKIPTSEETERYYREINRKTYENMPLFDYIPYKTEDFWIGYAKPLTLNVLLTKDTPRIRAEVLAWIRSKGVDPATHQIIWKVGKLE